MNQPVVSYQCGGLQHAVGAGWVLTTAPADRSTPPQLPADFSVSKYAHLSLDELAAKLGLSALDCGRIVWEHARGAGPKYGP